MDLVNGGKIWKIHKENLKIKKNRLTAIKNPAKIAWKNKEKMAGKSRKKKENDRKKINVKIGKE